MINHITRHEITRMNSTWWRVHTLTSRSICPVKSENGGQVHNITLRRRGIGCAVGRGRHDHDPDLSLLYFHVTIAVMFVCEGACSDTLAFALRFGFRCSLQ